MKREKKKVSRKTIKDTMRGRVPGGKLKGARVVFTNPIFSDMTGVGGFTSYDRKRDGMVDKICVPDGDNAQSLVIQGHEGFHATHSKLHRKKPSTPLEQDVTNIVDDVNVECKPLPAGVEGIRGYCRDHLAVIMQDVRDMVKTTKKEKPSPKLNNANLRCAVRALSMLRHYSNVDAQTRRQAARGIEKIREIIGYNSERVLRSVIAYARGERTRARAISMLMALMEAEFDPDDDQPEFEIPKDGDGDTLFPVKHGDALEGKVEYLDLRPKSVFTAKEKTVSRKSAPDGVIINANRYVNAIASGDANGLFSRRVRFKPGGTVMIDASGSMGASKHNLSKLCQLIPTATVAYYSGSDRSGDGIITIYAYEGKRFNGELPEDTLRGGNSVDLPAVRWLLDHPKPWTFVSDMEFCGGVLGSEDIARALVERETTRGNLTVHHSLDAAYEAFGGKGNIDNP